MTVLSVALAAVVSILLTRWQLTRERADRLAEARLDLVRRMARNKSGPELAACLNEVPVLFGDNEDTLVLYRLSLPDSTTGSVDMKRVVDLLHHLASRSGLAQKTTADDLARGFSAAAG